MRHSAGQPGDCVSSPEVLEWMLMGLRVNQGGEVSIQNFDGGFYVKDYLSQSNCNCNKSWLSLTYLEAPCNVRP